MPFPHNIPFSRQIAFELYTNYGSGDIGVLCMMSKWYDHRKGSYGRAFRLFKFKVNFERLHRNMITNSLQATVTCTISLAVRFTVPCHMSDSVARFEFIRTQRFPSVDMRS